MMRNFQYFHQNSISNKFNKQHEIIDAIANKIIIENKLSNNFNVASFDVVQ